MMTANLNEIDGTCNRVPDLHISPNNLTRCMALNSLRSERPLRMHINLKSPKYMTFSLVLSGMGLNCSPIGGISLLPITARGESTRCKAFVGSNEGGIDTCPYQCKCPGVCSKVVMYISDKMAMSLCKIVVWNASNVTLWNMVCQSFFNIIDWLIALITSVRMVSCHSLWLFPMGNRVILIAYKDHFGFLWCTSIWDIRSAWV